LFFAGDYTNLYPYGIESAWGSGSRAAQDVRKYLESVKN